LHFFLTAFFLDNSILPYFVNYFKGELEFLEVTQNTIVFLYIIPNRKMKKSFL